MPEHHAGRLFLHVEKIELRTQPPMIAFLCFLEHAEVRVLLFLFGPGRP